MRYAFILLFIASTAFAQNITDTPEGKDSKLPVPSDAELTGPRNDLNEVFGDQIKASRTTSAKSKLASELLNLASSTEDPFDKYALIDQAKKLATEARDLTLTFQIIDLTANAFQVDEKQLRQEALTNLTGGSAKEIAAIKQLEELDVLAKKDPTKIDDVADDCYKLTRTLRDPLRQLAAERTIQYYEAALPQSSKLKKLKAEERIKELGGKTKPVENKPTPQSQKESSAEYLPGKWRIQHWPNRGWRTYEISLNGAVYFVEEKRQGMLIQRNGDLLLDFNDGKIERFNLSNHRLFVEHFNPKNNFPYTPDQIGIGFKVDVKPLLGIWEVKVGNDKPVRWKFMPSGVVLSSRNTPAGKWTVKPDKIEIKWDNSDAWDTFNYPLQQKEVTGDNWGGQILRARKL